MEFGEDFGGVAFGADGVPDFFDFAFGIDKKAAANNAEERASEKLLHASRSVCFDSFEIGIAKKIEVQLVLSFETSLSFYGVAAHPNDRRVQFIEFFLCVAKLGRFDRSTGSIGFGKQKEDDASAAEVGKRDIGAGVVFELEHWSLVAGFEHESFSVFLLGDVVSEELNTRSAELNTSACLYYV